MKKDKRKRPDRRVGPRRKSVLVEDWKKAYKFLSVQIIAVIAAAQGLLVFVPTIKDFIPPSLWHGLMATLAIAAIVGRVINQGQK